MCRGLGSLPLDSTSTLNSCSNSRSSCPTGVGGEGRERLRPLGFYPLALVTKDGAVELFFVLKKLGWGWG